MELRFADGFWSGFIFSSFPNPSNLDANRLNASPFAVWADLRRRSEERGLRRGDGRHRARGLAGPRPQGVSRRPGLRRPGQNGLPLQHAAVLQVHINPPPAPITLLTQ